jgi:hypothetical protein
MHPFFLFLLAILSPFLLAIPLLVPLYGSIAGATYLIYDTANAVHPLAGKFGEPFYIITVYQNLLTQWMQHPLQYDIVAYTLPLMGLPVVGVMLTLWLTGFVARKLKDIFQLGASV